MTEHQTFEHDPIINELLDALVRAHQQADAMLAAIITLDKTFRPSKSPFWLEMMLRHELLKRYGRFKSKTEE